MKQVKVRLDSRTILESDRTQIKYILDMPTGWRSHGYVFKIVHKNADVTMYMCSGDSMTKKFPFTHLQGLSVTDTETRTVYLNENNWNIPPANFIGKRSLYRAYLIQHEMGHCLGWSHSVPSSNPRDMCPVMYQQSLGTRGICKASADAPVI